MILAHLNADLKQLKREPIMLLFALISLLMIAVFRSIDVFGLALILEKTDFDPMSYRSYIAVMVFLLQPVMLGTVMGFFMLDEKDAGIMDLLSVTPLGISGYLFNRLLLPVLLTLVYSIMSMMVFGWLEIGFFRMLVLLLFLSMETVCLGMFIASVSEDKVKGLTNAKAVSALTIAGFADLFTWPGVRWIAALTPQYYAARLLTATDLWNIAVGFGVHALWLYLILHRTLNRL